MRRIRLPQGKLTRVLSKKNLATGVVVTAATAGAIFAWVFRGAPQPGGVVVEEPGELQIDLDATWPMFVMVEGASGTGQPDGADGIYWADINGDSLPDNTVGYEQGLRLSVSLHPGVDLATSTAAWTARTVILPSSAPNLCSVEDAVFADIDLDGAMDVVAACETGSVRVTAFFAPTPPNTDAELLAGANWDRMDMAASAGNRSMRVAVANIAGDSRPEIIVGGKESSGPCAAAYVGYYSSSDPRNDAGWTFTQIAPVGWVMNMYVTDLDGDSFLDVVWSDRERVDCPSIDNSKRGLRWARSSGGATPTWTPLDISSAVEGGPQGDHKWFDLTDYDGDGDMDIVGCRSSDVVNVSYVFQNLGGFVSWSALSVPQPTGVGQCQHAIARDFDGDGKVDFAFSYSNAPSLAGLAWQKQNGTSFALSLAQGEVSGVLGANDTKFDNLVAIDVNGDGRLDLSSTEQHLEGGAGPGVGSVWFMNVGVELGEPDPPDASPPDAPPPEERDTVACTLLTAGSTTTDATSFATASVSPGANRALYAFSVTATGSGPVAPSIITANGLTWAEVATVTFSSGNRRLTALRSMGASPSAGVVTFDFAGQTQTSFIGAVFECTGVDTSGSSASGATVQSVTSSVTGATTASATLAALENATNGTVCATGLDINSSVTPDPQLGELSDTGVANGNSTLQIGFGVGQTGCDTGFSTANGGILAIEVKAGSL